MRTSGFKGKGSLSSTAAAVSSSTARGEGAKGINGRNKVFKAMTVEDAMNEFHRLSSIVTRKVRAAVLQGDYDSRTGCIESVLYLFVRLF